MPSAPASKMSWYGSMLSSTSAGDEAAAGAAEELERTFEETEGYDEMVLLTDIRFESHCEHHLAPSVPFHALPALHKEVGHEMNPLDKGYWAVQWDVFRDHLEKKLRFYLIQST